MQPAKSCLSCTEAMTNVSQIITNMVERNGLTKENKGKVSKDTNIVAAVAGEKTRLVTKQC